MRWGCSMDMSLRAFIKYTVGNVELAEPWVYNNINKLLTEVEGLKKGVGLTVSVSDVIALNVQKPAAMNGMIDNVIMPAEGIVKGFYGAATTAHSEVELRIIRTSQILGTHDFRAQVTTNPQFFVLDLPVKGGDILTFFLVGTTPEELRVSTPTPELAALEALPAEPQPTTPSETPEEPISPIVYDFTEVMGSFLIHLPATTYVGGSK